MSLLVETDLNATRIVYEADKPYNIFVKEPLDSLSGEDLSCVISGPLVAVCFV